MKVFNCKVLSDVVTNISSLFICFFIMVHVIDFHNFVHKNCSVKNMYFININLCKCFFILIAFHNFVHNSCSVKLYILYNLHVISCLNRHLKYYYHLE